MSATSNAAMPGTGSADKQSTESDTVASVIVTLVSPSRFPVIVNVITPPRGP